MRTHTGPILIFLFLLQIVFIAHPVEGLTVDSEKEYLPAQTFPPENYEFTVDLGPDDWDYVLSLGNYNDSLHGVFDVVPSGLPIDFFVCDYDNLLILNHVKQGWILWENIHTLLTNFLRSCENSLKSVTGISTIFL